MPIFWRYLASRYLQIFFLSLCSFIGILLITRMREIARFISLSSEPFSVVKYIFYQIPHILPFAIAISSFIASILLFQRFSQSNELNALRVSGLTLMKIIFPILVLSFFISSINFYISSEWTTQCLAKSKQMIIKESAKNPITLIKKQNISSKLQNCFFDMKTSNDDQLAKDVTLIIPNHNSKRLQYVYMDALSLDKALLVGENISLISYLSDEKLNSFDSLVLETQKQMNTISNTLLQSIKTKKPMHNPIHLCFQDLLSKHAKLKKRTHSQRYESIPAEITRRLILGLCVFTFTLIGISFGIFQKNPKANRKRILYASFLILMILISFILGKALKYYFLFALINYLTPQMLAIFFCLRNLRKIERGAL